MHLTKRRGRPDVTGRPRNSAGWLMNPAFCVGGYDDYNNVANGGMEQNADGATSIVVFAHARNDFCGRHLPTCGERGHAQRN